LGEIAEFSKGQGYSKSDLKEDGIPIILYGRLYTKYESVISEVDTFVVEQKNSVFSNGNEVIVPASGETAEDISRASVVENAGIILGGDLNIIKPNSEVSSTFLAITISNGTQQKELSEKAQGKSVVHIHNSDLKEVLLSYPEASEQISIGNFFRTLDDLITLHKRKLEGLKELKKGYLQQMFPQVGESVPQVWFAEFTDSWKERKLGEIGRLQSGIGFPNLEQGGIEGVPFFKISDMNNDGNEHEMVSANNYVNNEQLQRKEWKPISEVPAIIFAKVGAAIMLNRKRIVRTPFLIDNNIMVYIFDNSWNLDFGKTLFETIDLPRFAQIGALPSYNVSDIEKIDVIIPALHEQIAIGKFFRSLDEQITIQQQKLDKLKRLKSAYLQKMFI